MTMDCKEAEKFKEHGIDDLLELDRIGGKQSTLVKFRRLST